MINWQSIRSFQRKKNQEEKKRTKMKTTCSLTRQPTLVNFWFDENYALHERKEAFRRGDKTKLHTERMFVYTQDAFCSVRKGRSCLPLSSTYAVVYQILATPTDEPPHTFSVGNFIKKLSRKIASGYCAKPSSSQSSFVLRSSKLKLNERFISFTFVWITRVSSCETFLFSLHVHVKSS